MIAEVSRCLSSFQLSHVHARQVVPGLREIQRSYIVVFKSENSHTNFRNCR